MNLRKLEMKDAPLMHEWLCKQSRRENGCMKTICVAGKNNVAVGVLEHCIDKYPEIRKVVICNKNDTGRNGWQRSLKWYAQKNDIQICDLEDVYRIKDLVFLSLEFDRILKPEKFNTEKIFNIHFSLLPKFKGCHTSVLPILHGEKETGVTLHKVNIGIDTGEIIDQKVIEIDHTISSLDLYEKLIETGTEVVIKNLENLLSGNFKCYPQGQEDSTYYSISEINYSNIQLNTRCTAYQIQNQIRAFYFRPYQVLTWNGERFVGAEVLKQQSSQKPGTVLDDTDIFTILATIDYDIKIYKDVLEKLFVAIKQKDNAEAKRLCSCETILKSKDEHGWSPLTVAVYNNNMEMVEYLVESGADINVLNNNGTTLLMYAKDTGFMTGDWTVMRYLRDLKLSPYTHDYRDKSIYDYVEESDMLIIPDDIKRFIIPENLGGGGIS